MEDWTVEEEKENAQPKRTKSHDANSEKHSNWENKGDNSKKNDSVKGTNRTKDKSKRPKGLPIEQQWRPKQSTSAILPVISEAPKVKE
jgi:hypothetical protein